LTSAWRGQGQGEKGETSFLVEKGREKGRGEKKREEGNKA